MPDESLIQDTPRGLYCAAGDFYVDAWQPVPRNVVTHAHSDHARRGAERYLASAQSAPLLRRRLGGDLRIDTLDYGQVADLGGVKLSLHPAGHLLGSAQVRIEHRGQVCVVSGDYKRSPDPACTPFELVPCHVFVTECTFGLPIFRWKDPASVTADINRWWAHNVALGRTSILLAYSLGKAQRVLAGLDADIGPILLHGAVDGLVQDYRAAGVALPPAQYATPELSRQHRGKALVIAPPSALNSPWVRRFSPHSVGMASGWMRVRGFQRRRGIDGAFVLSDHVDFPGLLQTIGETGAERVIATHGFTAPLVRLLRERGKDAIAFETRFGGEEEEVEIAEPDAEAKP